MFIPTGEVAENSLRDKFAAVGIPVRANYSSEEAGLIAAECKDCPENFHVAQSNVIVEVDNRDSVCRRRQQTRKGACNPPAFVCYSLYPL